MDICQGKKWVETCTMWAVKNIAHGLELGFASRTHGKKIAMTKKWPLNTSTRLQQFSHV